MHVAVERDEHCSALLPEILSLPAKLHWEFIGVNGVCSVESICRSKAGELAESPLPKWTHVAIHSLLTWLLSLTLFFFFFFPHWVAVSHVEPIVMTSVSKPLAPHARQTYLAIFSIVRRQDLRFPLHHPQKRHSSGTYHRSDFTNQSYTGVYDAGAPTEVCRAEIPPQWFVDLTSSPPGSSSKRKYPSSDNSLHPQRPPRRLRCRSRQSKACPSNSSIQPLSTSPRTATPR